MNNQIWDSWTTQGAAYHKHGDGEHVAYFINFEPARRYEISTFLLLLCAFYVTHFKVEFSTKERIFGNDVKGLTINLIFIFMISQHYSQMVYFMNYYFMISGYIAWHKKWRMGDQKRSLRRPKTIEKRVWQLMWEWRGLWNRESSKEGVGMEQSQHDERKW